MPPHEQKDMEKFIEEKAKELTETIIGGIQYGDSRDKPEWRNVVLESAKSLIYKALSESYSKGKEEAQEEVRKNCKECGTIYTCLCFNPKSAFYKGIK